MKKWNVAVLWGAAALAAACVTINVYFPTAAAEKAAERFVDDVLAEPQDEGSLFDPWLSGTGATGSLNMALVASFSGRTSGPIPANGEQITFVRIVIGPISNLTPGETYKVTHPYGVLDNLVADASGVIPIQRQDIGCAAALCDFTAVLGSAIGPFLRWDSSSPTAPTGFIGNPAVAHKVIGSPFGTNVFRIEGLNAGGSGVNTKEINLFTVQGKSTGTVPTFLVVDRATYTQPLPSAVNVIATSASSATLTVSGTGITNTMRNHRRGLVADPVSP